MTTHTPVGTDILSHDFLVATYGKLDQPKIDAAITALKAQTASYTANGNVASLVFYSADVLVRKRQSLDV